MRELQRVQVKRRAPAKLITTVFSFGRIGRAGSSELGSV